MEKIMVGAHFLGKIKSSRVYEFRANNIVMNI